MYYNFIWIILYIQGENLNLVLTNDDVTVLVGDAHCNVTSIADTQLTCRLPTPEPEGVQHNPVVTVCLHNFILWLYVNYDIKTHGIYLTMTNFNFPWIPCL